MVRFSAIGRKPPNGQRLDGSKTDAKCVGAIKAFLRAFPKPSRMVVESFGFIEWFLDRFHNTGDGALSKHNPSNFRPSVDIRPLQKRMPFGCGWDRLAC